jgi:hypothetical protein
LRTPLHAGTRNQNTIIKTIVTRLTLLLSLCLLCAGAVARPPESLSLQGYSSIALTRLKTGHLTMQARINGVSGRFVLDTGAGRSVIAAGRQEKFRLGRFDRKVAVATGAGGDLPLRMSHGNRLQIGSYVDYGFTAYLMPLDQVNLAFLRRGQEGIDGVIGSDVLRSGRAVIDYAGRRLYLRPKAAAAPTKHAPTKHAPTNHATEPTKR